MIRILAIMEAASVTGPAKNLLELCRTTRASGELEISIATFDRGGETNAFMKAVDDAAVRLIRIPERGAWDLRSAGLLSDLATSESPDIVQTHAIKSHFLVYLSRLWKRRRWIAFHHGYTTPDAKMRAYNQLDRFSLRAAKRVVTVSQAFKLQLLARGVEAARIDVVHNAVNLDWANRVRSLDKARTRATLGFAPEDRVLLAVGRMSLEKRHIDLIAAYRQLRREGRPIRLVFVGDGPERSQLEVAAAGEAIFTGQIEDTAPYYAASDMLVLPSLTEGSPNVLLEAMAVELPVVATRVGGIPEIVSDGETARLVQPLDPAALAAAIREVLDHRDRCLRMVAKARDLIETEYTPQARATALLALYRQVLNANLQ